MNPAAPDDRPAPQPLSTARPAQPLSQASGATEVPLVVDLDGSILRTDLLIESVFVLARGQPWALLLLPVWLLRGRAWLKAQLMRRAMPDIRALPRRTEVLDYLRAEKARGRHLLLATAADRSAAQRLADELGLFDAVAASDGHRNLRGERKRALLVERFGERGFDYLGNGRCDLAVWRSARSALLVGPSAALVERVRRTTPVAQVFADANAGISVYLQALRVHHWLKNVLVFVPLALTFSAADPQLIAQVLLAFFAFSLCASSVYLLNDLLDLPADRRHPHKKERMLASGRMPLLHALLMLPLILAAALAIGWSLLPAFAGLLALYFCLMLVYSLGLKDLPLIDVLVLATGYSLRVLSGALVAGLHPSPWLLTFSTLLFFSLALIKRYAELVLMESMSALAARGYRIADRGLLVAQGVASGYLAILVLALQTHGTLAQPQARQSPLFWALYLLLFYWVNYLWLMAQRGRMPDDPLLFAVTDRVSLAVAVCMAAVAMAALW